VRDEVSGIGESRGKGKDKSSAAGIGDEERTRTSGREERIDGERERERERDGKRAENSRPLVCILQSPRGLGSLLSLGSAQL